MVVTAGVVVVTAGVVVVTAGVVVVSATNKRTNTHTHESSLRARDNDGRT